MILHQTLASIDLDRESLPQNSLDIADRVRTNLLPWTGQFSPQLVEQLLKAYAPHNGVVLDPFVGSGTSLIEAARLKLTARGSELNPAAVVLANVYRLINKGAAERGAATNELHHRIFCLLAPSLAPLFADRSNSASDRSELESALVDLWRQFAPGAAKDLAAALVVLCDFYRRRLDNRTVQSTWERLRETVHALPRSDRPVTVYHADARELPFQDNSFDLVLTSPPYINVHNYHQQYRRSIEALACDVLAIAPSEIGSNRQNRGNRFLTVIQYALDISLALREIARTMRPGALSILVLGRESTVRGVRFFNGELVAELAVRAVGMRMERRQERVFRNRYGKAIYEDILHFRSTGDVPGKDFSLSKARRIAEEILSATRSSIGPHQECLMLDDALARLCTVSPSPMLVPQQFPNLFSR